MRDSSYEHERVRTSALRALRAGFKHKITERDLARFAETDAATAGAVLRVLAHEGSLVSDRDPKRPSYSLAQAAAEGAAV